MPHVCSYVAFKHPPFSDFGYCATVTFFRNRTDLQMKNTLKPLDGRVCAELKLSYIHKLSAPRGAVETPFFSPET